MYLNNFKNNEDIVQNFSGTQYGYSEEDQNKGKDKIQKDLEGSEILLAWYGDGSFCGDAFVLYRNNGVLYEVNGSHCSCYGLEDQWNPEETSWEALKKREIYDSCNGADEANRILKELISKNAG